MIIDHSWQSTQRTKQAEFQVKSTRAMSLSPYCDRSPTTCLAQCQEYVRGRSNLSVPCFEENRNKEFAEWIEIVCAARLSREEKAMNAKVRAFLSTYLDIALGDVGRLERLAVNIIRCRERDG